MESITFIKDEFTKAVSAPIDSIDAVKELLDYSTKGNTISIGSLYTYLNRRIYLKSALDALNSKDQKLLMIGGFQGTGKTEFVKSIICAIEDNVLNFNYECSKITNLDDIILTLYGYLNRLMGKESDFQRISKLYGPQSVDESLFAILKNLKRPLIVVLDGFENLVSEDLKVESDLINFFNFLISIPTVKLIISGRKIPSTKAFKVNEKGFSIVRLSGLDESDAMRLLVDNGVIGSSNTLYQAYQITRGYPESLFWFIAGIKYLETDAFDLIQRYSQTQQSFEEFIAKKVYETIPEDLKKIVWLLSSIRHSVRFAALHKLNLTDDLEKTLEYLTSRMIIKGHDNSFYIKSFLNSIIYDSIPANEKIRIHKYLHELYSEQIPLKISERVFHISRKILHSEQFYHYTVLTNLEKGAPPNGISWRKEDSDPIYSKVSVKSQNLVLAVDTAVFDSIDIQEVNKDNELNKLDDGFNLELSEEEKMLIDDENKTSTEELKKEKIIPQRVSDIKANLIMLAEKLEIDENYEEAFNNYKKALALYSEENNLEQMAYLSATIGRFLGHIQEYDKAVDYLNQALTYYTNLNAQDEIKQVTLSIANIYNDSYKHDLALQYYNFLLKNEEPDDNDLIPETLAGIGDIYDYRGDLETALKYYNNSYEKALTLDNKELLAKLCFKIGLINDDINNTDKAFEFYTKSIKVSDDPEININLASSYANIAAMYEEAQKKDHALSYYLKSLDVDKEIGNYEGQYKTLSRLVNIYKELGNKEKTLFYIHEELRAAKQTDDPYSVAISYMEAGDFYYAVKAYEKAIKAFILARKSINKTVSTDSKEKIDRRLRRVVAEIGEDAFNSILKNAKRKNE